MDSRSMVGLALVALCTWGCGDSSEHGHRQIAPQPTTAQAGVVAKDKRGLGSGPQAAGDPTPRAVSASSVSDTTPTARPEPPWFQPDIWPGAIVESQTRAASDGPEEEASQILLSLPAGTTVEACAERLAAQVRPDVPNLRQEPVGRGEGDRLTLRGAENGYQVTIVCGREQETVKAYLGFQWTESPGVEGGDSAGPD